MSFREGFKSSCSFDICKKKKKNELKDRLQLGRGGVKNPRNSYDIVYGRPLEAFQANIECTLFMNPWSQAIGLFKNDVDGTGVVVPNTQWRMFVHPKFQP